MKLAIISLLTGATLLLPQVVTGAGGWPPQWPEFSRGEHGEILVPRGSGTVYEVGPGRTYANLVDVPWENLGAGDTVEIAWRAEPYREKILVDGVGAEAEPILVTGLPGPNGELPVIDGENAISRLGLGFPNEDKGVVTVEGLFEKPRWIFLANLEIRGGLPGNSFTDSDGNSDGYRTSAAGINVIRGEFIHILNCTIIGCGNGLFVASYITDGCRDSWCADEAYVSKDILVESCRIYDNAFSGSSLQHNVYTEALRITFQANYLGDVAAGANGNSLKDRSAGVVVRYNFIEGVRPIDFVEPEYGNEVLYDAPEYDETLCYGNVILKLPGVGNDRIIHYGGDNGDASRYRKGTLFFAHNTVIARRNDSVVFGLETSDEIVDARNNVFFAEPQHLSFWIIDGQGTANLWDNWISEQYGGSQFGGGGTVNETRTSTGSDPRFVAPAAGNFAPKPGSPLANLAGAPSPAVAADFPVDQQWQTPEMVEMRDDLTAAGAFQTATPLQRIRLIRQSPPAGSGPLWHIRFRAQVGLQYEIHTSQTLGAVWPEEWMLEEAFTAETRGIKRILPTPFGQNPAGYVRVVEEAF